VGTNPIAAVLGLWAIDVPSDSEPEVHKSVWQLERNMTKPIPGQTFPRDSSAVLGSRDAFHVPSVIVTWAAWVKVVPRATRPGANVRFTNDEQTQVEPCEYSERQAIADPFLESIEFGVAFWVFIIPELVGGLTHNFEILPKPNPLDNIEDEYQEPYEDDGCGGCYDEL
jgi:hypothetical protein